MRAVRAVSLAAVLAAGAAFAPPSAACPSCAASSSPKEPNVWPLVGAFMLVPWALAAAAALVVRRNSRPS